jgi:hypothetical protein
MVTALARKKNFPPEQMSKWLLHWDYQVWYLLREASLICLHVRVALRRATRVLLRVCLSLLWSEHLLVCLSLGLVLLPLILAAFR